MGLGVVGANAAATPTTSDARMSLSCMVMTDDGNGLAGGCGFYLGKSPKGLSGWEGGEWGEGAFGAYVA